METNVHSRHYRYHLTSVVWKRKKCAINGNNIDSRMTLLIFLSRLQIVNYVMTAFIIQPIKTVLSHLRVAVAKFQYPFLNGLIAFLLFWQHQGFVYLVSFPYSSSLQNKMFPRVFTYIRTWSSVKPR